MEEKILGKRLTNALLNCTSLPRKGDGSCVLDKKIKSKYDRIEQIKSKYDRIKWAKDGDHKKENRDRKKENGDRERKDGGRKG